MAVKKKKNLPVVSLFSPSQLLAGVSCVHVCKCGSKMLG